VSGSRAAFLDRDGVINVDHGYVSHWRDFEFLPGVESSLRQLQDLGYRLVVITNQSGIGRGYYTEADFSDLTQALKAHLAEQGVVLDGVYHCPHHPIDALDGYRIACDCRKPKPGLIFSAADELGIDLAQSVLIGDKPSDIQAGIAAGVGRLFQIVGAGGDVESGAVPVTSLADMVIQLSA